jgi:hypothetical protein
LDKDRVVYTTIKINLVEVVKENVISRYLNIFLVHTELDELHNTVRVDTKRFDKPLNRKR